MSNLEKDETQTEIGAAPAPTGRLRRWLKRTAWVVGIVTILLVATVIVFRLTYHGNKLGDRVSKLLSAEMRGTVDVESIEWSVADVPGALVGGWLPVVVRDLEVYDEFGDLVLKTERLTAEVNVHDAIRTQTTDVVLRRIVAANGGFAKIKQVREPYPESEFDHNVVSLISAFYPNRPPEFRAGLPAKPGRVWDLHDYEVSALTMEFDFPEFHAIVYGLAGSGGLRSDASDPLAKKLYYTLAPSAPIGVLRAGGSFEVLTDIRVERLALLPGKFPREAFPRDLEYELHAKGTGGANIHVVGAMLDHQVDFYGGEHDITLTVDDAALPSKLIARDLSPESASDIEAGSLSVRVTGPVAAPKVSMRVQEVTYAQPNPAGAPIELTLANAVASFDLATESGSLEDTIVRGLGGQVELAATFGLKPLLFDAKLTITEPLNVPNLPAQVKAVVGSRLSGSLHAIGDQHIQRLEEIDLKLGRARLQGMAYRTQSGLIGAEGLRIELDRTIARNVYGSVNLQTKEVDLHLRKVESKDFGRLLARLGYPTVAESLDGFIHVGGTLDDIRAGGKLDFGGVPIVSSVVTDFSFGNQTLSINSAQANGYGGSMIASGKVDLAGAPTLRGFNLTGRNLALDRVPGIGSSLTGRGSIDAVLSGPVSAPVGTARASLSNWTVAGDRFADATIEAFLEAGGGVRVKTDIAREDGGRLKVDGGLSADGKLQGVLDLTRLPVAGILALAGFSSKTAGGTVSSKLTLSGTPDSPTADGFLAATRAWVGGGFLGGVELDVERIDNGVVHVRGKLLQGRVQIDGSIATVAPFAADLDLRFHRIEADQFLPELAERFGTRAWISGSLAYRGDLVGTRRKPEILARLTEVEAVLDNEDTRGRPAPVRVRSQDAIEISYDGTDARLLSPAVFALPGGKLTMSGKLSGEQVDVSLEGTVALGLLRRYFADKFEEVGGEVDVNFAVAGTIGKPKIRGSLMLRDVSVKPVGQDASVKIAAGLIKIDEDAITTTGIELVVIDEFSDEAAHLDLSVTVALDGLEPGEWAVQANGDLGGKMLLVFAPDLFSAASGRAELDIEISGRGRTPELRGEIVFDDTDSLAFTPRGVRREIRLTDGSVSLSNNIVNLTDVAGWIDDEGQIVSLSGELSLRDLKPDSLELNFTARDLPFRIPGVLLLSVNINNGQLIGNFEPDTQIEDRLQINGRIEVVDGRYIERWSPVINNLRPQRIAEAAPPVWETVPLIGNAQLDLRVESPAFFVQNNIADITMAGNLAVQGTPLAPKIEGVIRVDQGSFKIPGVRANFTRTSGTVAFSKFQDFPTSTPKINITSESDYRDLRGQNHLVQMRLTGPIENISWDLLTANGLNRAQTLTLIFSGRTPADARRLFGDEPIGRRPGEYANNLSTVDSESTAAVLDRVAKDLVGDQLDRILGDPIKNLTKLDVVRFEVGTASLGMHVEKDVTKSFRLLGDAERTLRGWTAALSAENRLNDTVSIEANGLEKRFDDETLEDERDLKLRLTWRKVLLP